MEDVRKQRIIFSIIGIVPVIWIALLLAPYVDKGLLGIINNFNKVLSEPFNIVICEDSLKTVLFLLLAYGLGIGIFFSTRKNYRRQEEYGSQFND